MSLNEYNNVHQLHCHQYSEGSRLPKPLISHFGILMERCTSVFIQKSIYVHNACLITKCFQKPFFLATSEKSDSGYPICHYLVLTVLISPVAVGACHLLMFGMTSLSNVFVFYEEHLNIFLDFLRRRFIDVVYFSSSE